MGNPQANNFFIKHVTEEISEEISKLNPFKSTGPYSIPIKILIFIKDLISSHYKGFLIVHLTVKLSLKNLKSLMSYQFIKKGLNYV